MSRKLPSLQLARKQHKSIQWLTGGCNRAGAWRDRSFCIQFVNQRSELSLTGCLRIVPDAQAAIGNR